MAGVRVLRQLIAAGVCLVLQRPITASAQWSAAFYGGATHTAAADVGISVPAFETNLTLEAVPSLSDSWRSPIYYGFRFGYSFGEERRVGVEVEFTHAKVFLDRNRTVTARGIVRGAPVNGPLPVSSLVQRLSVSHGLNFLLANVVVGHGVGSNAARPRLRIEGRAGAGVTAPHVEAVILGLSREDYQYGGPGAQLAAGVLVRVAGPLFALGEYKLTVARESLAVAGGRVRATFVAHHGILGASWIF